MSAIKVLELQAVSRIFVQHHHLPLPTERSIVEVSDAPEVDLQPGGFGALLPVKTMDGADPLRPLLAKVFNDDALADVGGPTVMSSHISQVIARLDECIDADWPEQILAAPFCMLQGELAGKQRLITLMLDLRHLGYGTCPFDPNEAQVYRARDFEQRANFALVFAARYATLERIGFVHGDLNPENILLAADRCDVQIIDIDTGTFVIDGSERPLTPGKPDDCMPPEVTNLTMPGFIDMGKYTAAAERWSVGSVIGYFLFAVHPGFFLREISTSCLDEYASSGHRWPNIDTRSATFTKIRLNRNRYEHYWREAFDASPSEVRELFGHLFLAGSLGSLRPSAQEWIEALSRAEEPPTIESITVEPRIVLAGDLVHLSWVTQNASRVEIDGVGPAPAARDALLPVQQTTAFTIRAFSPYGKSCTATSPTVRVVELPRFEKLPLPSFPATTLTAHIELPRLPSLVAPSVASARSPAPTSDAPETPQPLPPHSFFGNIGRVSDVNVHLDLPTRPFLADLFGAFGSLTSFFSSPPPQTVVRR